METSYFIGRKVSSFLFAFLLLSPIFLSCSKEQPEQYFYFNVNGGPCFFNNVKVEGSTLILSDNSETGKSEYWPESSVDDDELWILEISWIRVYYQPSKKVLRVMADKNDSGKKRTARITGSQDGKKVEFVIDQAY